MTPRLLLPAVVLAVAAAGCVRLGQAGADLRPAQGPYGGHAEVTTGSGLVSGELIAVRDDGLLVLGARRLVVVPFGAIRAPSRVEHVRLGASPTAQEREQARLLSRFPQGAPPAVLDRLLRDAGQAEPDLAR